MAVMTITGGTAGVGKATAVRFARAGYDVGIIARDRQSLEATQQILQMAKSERPDAIFAGSDEVACGLISALSANGISVPGELAVMGFDNLPVAEMVHIPLTTVSQPIEQLGRISVERLLALINNTHYRYDEEDLKSELVIRASA
jgi:LacI family repressor for deo operon, udp, cdd, tsx, nupC, and nupG